MTKKIYTREEKIEFYKNKIRALENQKPEVSNYDLLEIMNVQAALLEELLEYFKSKDK